jgi:hypothetical protein
MSNESEPHSNTHKPRYGTVDREYGMKLATTRPEDDGPVWMVNLMKYRTTAEYADGRSTTMSGREADDAYAPLEQLAKLGAEVVFVADVEQQLFGEPKWDRIGVVKYPTRRSFIELQTMPGFAEKHAHKDAGMEQTFVIGCQPIAVPQLPASAPQWSDVPHPPTAEDPEVVVMHVLKFQDASSVDHMSAYQEIAGSVAVPNGARIHGWFEAEGTIMGDGRTWDQVRFNGFPSKAAFMAVLSDPARLVAQAEHRQPAVADTYALVLRPRINRL